MQQGHPQLVAWRVTGKSCLQVEFQSKLPSYSGLTLGGRAQQELTIAHGNSGVAERETDPFCAPVPTIADYPTGLLNEGKSYRTINSHGSAISAFHPPVDGTRVGQHELICKVVGACFNANPPQPKYVATWDVDIGLEHMRSLGGNPSLSDKIRTLNIAYNCPSN